MENLKTEEFKSLVKFNRNEIKHLEKEKAFLEKHGFNEEARVVQIKISAMFRVYDYFRDYYENTTGKHIDD